MSEKQIFRKEAMKTISSPDQLTDFLHVTNPTVWIVLITVVVLLVGLFAWATIGDLESTAEVSIAVRNGEARVIATGRTPVAIKEGMKVRAEGKEFSVEKVGRDNDGWMVGAFPADLPDGQYSGVIVTDSVKPISFLVESR